MRNLIKLLVLVCFLLVISASRGLAQQKDELQEKKERQTIQEKLEEEVLEQRKQALEPPTPKKYKFTSRIEVEGTYETNPRLTTIRKSDRSGRIKYSAYYKRLLVKDFTLSINYDLDGTGYSDFTELTNILNHVRIAIDKPINKAWTTGSGYDFSSFYYPSDKDSTYNFHKGYVYLRQNITKNIYHQVMWEEGVKDYVHARGYLNSTSTFLDEKRRDYRHALEYSAGALVFQKTTFKVRTKYSINDSNALYQDYHDYQSLDITPSIYYPVSEKVGLNLSMTYSGKAYQERLVADSEDTRHDSTFSPNLGLSYHLNKDNMITLGYGYTQNLSNDPTAEYSSSSINCGWLHDF